MIVAASVGAWVVEIGALFLVALVFIAKWKFWDWVGQTRAKRAAQRTPWRYLVGLVAGVVVGTIVFALGSRGPAPYIGGVAFAISLYALAWWEMQRQHP